MDSNAAEGPRPEARTKLDVKLGESELIKNDPKENLLDKLVPNVKKTQKKIKSNASSSL